MKRTASASWTGNLKQGKGTITTQSGVLKDSPYGFATRFGNQSGTNPEELIAAAHSGCFTMALSAFLERAGFTAEKIATTATVSLDQEGENWSINTIHLDVNAKIPNISQSMFEEIAGNAKSLCPVSRVLKATISMEAKLL